ncbi:unnamed protein product [Ectocarpus sp. 12 AP-2014]
MRKPTRGFRHCVARICIVKIKKYITKPNPSKAKGRTNSHTLQSRPVVQRSFRHGRDQGLSNSVFAEAGLVIVCRGRRDEKTDQSERRKKTAYHRRVKSHQVSYRYAEREREGVKPHARPSPPTFLPFQKRNPRAS